MPATWLTVLAWLALVGAFVCAGVDVYARGYRQRMPIMDAVRPVTARCAGSWFESKRGSRCPGGGRLRRAVGVVRVRLAVLGRLLVRHRVTGHDGSLLASLRVLVGRLSDTGGRGWFDHGGLHSSSRLYPLRTGSHALVRCPTLRT